MKKLLYYPDIYFINEDGQRCGDLGFELDAAEARTDNPDELTNPANIRDLAAEYAPDMVIYSVYRAMFEDIDASTPEEFCTSCAKMVSEPELFFQAIA